MSLSYELTDPDKHLLTMGIDPSTPNGAHMQALKIRRYWLERGVDVKVERVVTVHRIDEPGADRNFSRTVYGVKADWANAKKIGPEEVARALLGLIEEADIYV